MNDVATRIKAYVLVIFPTLTASVGISDDQLTYLVQEVIDRALVYMNRDQLVYQYELDLVDYPENQDVNDLFWAEYERPIPTRLERTLANTVVQVARTVQSQQTASVGKITRIKDQGQEVQYSEALSSYLSSSSDSDIFSGTLGLLRRHILPTVVRTRDEYPTKL